MKQIIITAILTFTFTTFAIHAVEQTAFSGDGIIESTSGGFKFPDGTVLTSAGAGELVNRVAQLEAKLEGVSRGTDLNTGKDTIRFSGMNVQIVNGTGSTIASPNGKGNLIIGYNEVRDEENAAVPCPSDVNTEFWCNRRGGSHMLVIGWRNNYSSFGGMVVGEFNETSGTLSSVSGGQDNIASGSRASVSGGRFNIASGEQASVSGGSDNEASGKLASVSGGFLNQAGSGVTSSVCGVYNNQASGTNASVSGGSSNKAMGENSSVSGGYQRTVGAVNDWRAGSLFEDN